MEVHERAAQRSSHVREDHEGAVVAIHLISRRPVVHVHVTHIARRNHVRNCKPARHATRHAYQEGARHLAREQRLRGAGARGGEAVVPSSTLAVATAAR